MAIANELGLTFTNTTQHTVCVTELFSGVRNKYVYSQKSNWMDLVQLVQLILLRPLPPCNYSYIIHSLLPFLFLFQCIYCVLQFFKFGIHRLSRRHLENVNEL